jgi:MFS family permease
MVASAATRVSWVPLIAVAMAQVLLAFNITALKISIDAIVTSFEVSASVVKSAIVIYSLVVAGCILVGAKLAPVYGARRIFRATILLFGIAMLAMVVSTNAPTMIVAQILAGAASAAMVPTSVVLIADNYVGEQQTRALEWLSGARSASLAPAFLIAGAIATWSDWRLTFFMLSLLAAAIYLLSDKLCVGLSAVQRHSHLRIDRVGFALMMLALLLIGVGSENLSDWGVIRARPDAPFSMMSVSPALVVIACGVLLVRGLVTWSRKCRIEGVQPLLAPEVFAAPRERSLLFSIFTLGAVSSAVTFLIPLYVEIVQGRNSIHTAIALTPFTLASVAAAVLVGRLRGTLGPRQLARYSFLVVALGLALLGATIRNDWSDAMVIFSMTVAGFGEGALATLLFKVLLTQTPKELADDVEPVCDATSHLAAAVGTALAGALIVGLLSSSIHRDLAHNPTIADEIRTHLNLDRVSFVSNDHLREVLERSAASAEHVAEAVRINTQARLYALRVSFFALAGLASLAFIASMRAVASSSSDET